MKISEIRDGLGKRSIIIAGSVFLILSVFIALHIKTYYVFDAVSSAYAWNRTLLAGSFLVAMASAVFAARPARLIGSQKIRVLIGYAGLLLAPFIAVYVCEKMYDTSMFYMHLRQIYYINVAVYFLFYLLGMIVFPRRPGWAIITGTVITFMFSFACICVLNFRGTPFLPIDLYAAKTATAVMGRYTLTLTNYMVFGIVTLVCMICFAVNFLEKTEEKILLSAGKSALSAAAAAVILIWFWNTDPIQSLGYGFSTLNQAQYFNYFTYGTAASFLENLKHSVLKKPEGYTPDAAEAVLSGFEATEGDDTAPNIIVVMNESFCDYSMWGKDIGIAGGESCAPYFESLCEDYYHGRLLVSTMGGGTCNTEFETLTGCSLYGLPTGSFPYLQYMRNSIGSYVKAVEQAGYTTIGMHPAPGSTWNRSNTYPMLGFDEILFEDEFDDVMEYCRDLASDRTTYRKVLQMIESHDEPVFVFDVTIQNHSAYIEGADKVLIELEDKDEYPLANNYVNLIRLSDEDLREFIGELEKLGEPCYVLFYGDHQAGAIEPEFESVAFGFDTSAENTAELIQQEYIVDYTIWTNTRPPESVEDGLTSANFLIPKLLNYAGLPLTPFQNYQISFTDSVCAINACGAVTADGDYYLKDEQIPDEIRSELNDYMYVQYLSMFGLNEGNEHLFLLK
ncbi:MAG: LTA synthase family protein [Oscillospiraceae bacterium]|nr:LTA synthase family protein [Oscillospiraceae bacterium]